jgi:hypothetical protein
MRMTYVLKVYLDLLKVKIIIRKYSYLFVIILLFLTSITISNHFTGYNFLSSPILLPVILDFLGAILKT